ncbi:MAG TPA: hypothetical protein VM934_03095 [Pyrinomonadaceae bacterium]|jgi:hypothetical protein|nr:hypothetical protein [Pyrinomonadaceae bacterium]
MNQTGKFAETAATYRKYGWQLARVLMRAETLDELRASAGEAAEARFEGVAVEESAFDAMWFTRAAQDGRDAWELRLVAEPPFALFELFEPDEAEEDREDVRREMEARMREHVAPSAADA